MFFNITSIYSLQYIFNTIVLNICSNIILENMSIKLNKMLPITPNNCFEVSPSFLVLKASKFKLFNTMHKYIRAGIYTTFTSTTSRRFTTIPHHIPNTLNNTAVYRPMLIPFNIMIIYIPHLPKRVIDMSINIPIKIIFDFNPSIIIFDFKNSSFEDKSSTPVTASIDTLLTSSPANIYVIIPTTTPIKNNVENNNTSYLLSII